ncbi:MAG: hypothetical protein ACP5QI_01495 [Candidatus Bathyarchaeia archaeon]
MRRGGANVSDGYIFKCGGCGFQLDENSAAWNIGVEPCAGGLAVASESV